MTKPILMRIYPDGGLSYFGVSPGLAFAFGRGNPPPLSSRKRFWARMQAWRIR